ncbi:MAG: DUF6084 family protein [Actinomycetota bacterium]
MVELAFDCLDVQPDRYAAVPTLVFKLKIAEVTGETIHAIALRCQIRIEPYKRRYSPEEEERVLDLFGERSRWGETLKPMQFAFAAQMVPGFKGSAEVDLPVPCTYDFEVASAKYFASLLEGEIPLLLLFSGTVFAKGETGFSIHQVPWHKEANYRLPVRVWKELMDRFFPNSAWIRLRRDTFDALHVFKSRLALPTWDDVVERLLKKAGAQEEGRAS